MKTLSYFFNKKFLGTPFENFQGQLYICLEICCIGSFEIIKDPELPDMKEI